jgi:hypothetical protein
VVRKSLVNAVAVLLFIAIVLMLVTVYATNGRKGYTVVFYVFTAVCVAAFASFIHMFVAKDRMCDGLFMGLVLLLTVGLRALWVFKVPTLPISDYLANQSYAFYFINGFFNAYDPSYSVFPHKMSYPLVIQLIYKFTGVDINAAKALNIVMSAGSVVLLYHIGKLMLDNRAGKTAALMFALWPAQIMFNSVLAPEHIFVFFLLLTVYCLLNIKPQALFRRELLFAVFTGISAAASQLFRPVIYVLFPAIFVYIVVLCQHAGAFLQKVIMKVLLLGVVVLSYFVSLYCINLAVQPVTGVDITRSSPGMSLLMGTNFESDGTYNVEDASYMREYDFDYEKVHSAAKEAAIGRIKDDPVRFASLVAKKYGIIWGNESYALEGALSNVDERSVDTNLLSLLTPLLEKCSQAYYIAILLLALPGSIFALKDSEYGMAVPCLVLFGFVVSFCFLDAKSINHVPAVPMFFLIGGTGLISMMDALSEASLSFDYEEPDKTAGAVFRVFTVFVCAAVFATVVLMSRNDKGIRRHVGVVMPAIYSNGVLYETDPMPVPIKGMILVPDYLLAEMTGAESELGEGNRIILSRGARKLVFELESSIVSINGQARDIGVPVTVMQGAVYIPLRAAAEGLGLTVNYFPETSRIEIRSPETSPGVQEYTPNTRKPAQGVQKYTPNTRKPAQGVQKFN